MGLPQAREAQPFYRSAKQRFADAEFLLEATRTTGAVYLAGYGVECILKALILNAAPSGRREEILASFRGARAHDYEWLRERYRELGGPSFPPDVQEHFVDVNTWSTDFRYQAGLIDPHDAEDFLEATRSIIAWADGRM